MSGNERRQRAQRQAMPPGVLSRSHVAVAMTDPMTTRRILLESHRRIGAVLSLPWPLKGKPAPAPTSRNSFSGRVALGDFFQPQAHPDGSSHARAGVLTRFDVAARDGLVQVGPNDESSSIVDIAEVLARREAHANRSDPGGAPSRLTRTVDAPGEGRARAGRERRVGVPREKLLNNQGECRGEPCSRRN
jgi:hypothetical protein